MNEIMKAVLLQPRIARTWREPIQKIVVRDVDEKLGATLKNSEQLLCYSMHITI